MENYQQEREKLDLQQTKDCIEREKYEFDITKQIRQIDIHGCKQEIIRRNIEACMNVLRVNGTVHGSDTIGKSTRTLAEDKVKEFLAKLEVV